MSGTSVGAARRAGRLLTWLLATFLALACDRARGATLDSGYVVLATYPHDTGAYTQGLLWDDDGLLESTGRYGYSQVRRVDLTSGRVRQSVRLPDDRFGEGLTRLGGRLYVLTWESRVGYVYDATTLAPLDSFSYAGEGWGLTTDGTSLIMSDGSDSLRYLSPGTLDVERVVHVRQEGSALSKINELEYVNGELLANVYESDWIVRIDPVTGTVLELIDFAELYPRGDRRPGADVMNGIARGPEAGTLLLTGKLWPMLYKVRLRGPASR